MRARLVSPGRSDSEGRKETTYISDIVGGCRLRWWEVRGREGSARARLISTPVRQAIFRGPCLSPSVAASFSVTNSEFGFSRNLRDQVCNENHTSDKPEGRLRGVSRSEAAQNTLGGAKLSLLSISHQRSS